MPTRTLRVEIIETLEREHPEWINEPPGRVPNVLTPTYQVRFAGRMTEISGNRYPECYEIYFYIGTDRSAESEDIIEELDEQMTSTLLGMSSIRRIDLIARGGEEESIATRNIVKRDSLAGISKPLGARGQVDKAKLSLMLYQVVAA